MKPYLNVATRKPGWSLEQPFYTDEEAFARDMQSVFEREWLYAGHVSQVRSAGDFFTLDIAGESIVVVRDADDTLHALANVCRHRGSRVCLSEEGNARRLVCPYHQWVYELDGRLASADAMPPDFRSDQFNLHRLPLEVVEGLIFVHLDASPPDFAPTARRLETYLAPHHFDRAAVCHSERYRVRANWKLIWENFRECYHCRASHPEYCAVMLSTETLHRAAAADEFAALTARMQRRWESAGLETATVSLGPESNLRCSRYPIREGYLTQSLDGRLVAPLMTDNAMQDMGVLGVTHLPSLMIQACADHADLTYLRPMSATESVIQVDWLVRDSAREDLDYRKSSVVELWKRTVEQDIRLCEDNQQGVSSRFYQPGPYSIHEDDTERFMQWYEHRIERAGAPESFGGNADE